jgi:hypothetical protein
MIPMAWLRFLRNFFAAGKCRPKRNAHFAMQNETFRMA